VRCCQY